MTKPMWPIVGALGIAQTVAWASTFYLPAAIGTALTAETGVSSTAFFGIVTAAMVLAALLGPQVGELTDRWGGRIVLSISTVAIAFGLILLSQAHDIGAVWSAWLALAFGMGLGLYEVSAATLAHIFKTEARRAIAYFTLIAGCASSVGWLLTSWNIDQLGWRGICLTWAALNIAVSLPLYLLLPDAADSKAAAAPASAQGPVTMPVEMSESTDNRLMAVLAVAFCAGALVVGGLAAHLPRVIELSGVEHKQALAAAALAGPAQIFMRLIEAMGLNRRSPLAIVGSSSLLHPIGAVMLLIGAPLGYLLFPLAHGMTTGVMITARATVPLLLFGPRGFGVRLGRLSRSIRVISALAPLIFSLLIDKFGVGVLWATSALCLASVAGFAILASMTAEVLAGRRVDDGRPTAPPSRA